MKQQPPFPTRTLLAITTIMSLRVIGIFMVLPIFSMAAKSYQFATPTLIGLAIGVYGFAQACLQIPMGMASDVLGRRRCIAIGLSLFAIGSLVAGYSTTVYGLILGRAIQGLGAIGSSSIALIADLTTEEQRTKAMALLGMSFGVAFSAAMMLGPFLNQWLGLHHLLTLSFWLGLFTLVLLFVLVPKPQRETVKPEISALPSYFIATLKHRQLLKINLGILNLHAILTLFFIAVPLLLTSKLHFLPAMHWKLYCPTLIAAFVLSVPLIILGEKRGKLSLILCIAIAGLLLSQLLLKTYANQFSQVALLTTLFFTAFSTLEACLPSLVSKLSPEKTKGTAMGFYATAKFIGIFLGGSLGGILLHRYSPEAVLVAGAGLASVWLIIALTLGKIHYHKTLAFDLRAFSLQDTMQLKQELATLPGVIDVSIDTIANTVQITIDKLQFLQQHLAKFLIIRKEEQRGQGYKQSYISR